ncbi:MAG: transposase [Chloroflexi bacterium]|nr:transposase [Chloroflexota bacterium]
MIEPATFNTLRQFRAAAYDRFGLRRDALFELLDAATVAGVVPSLAYLSLPPVHRRRWGSLYDALAAGDIDAPALRELIARYPLDDGQPMFALDTSVWPRDDAETSPARGHYFSSGRQSAGKPIVTGWSYAWLAQLSFTHDSWTAPLDVQRVPAGGSSHAVAAAQISELLEHLPAHGPVPMCVFDAGYDPEALSRELGELDEQHVAVLVRLRSDRCFYADPPPAISTKVGRPRRHGHKFTCADERFSIGGWTFDTAGNPGVTTGFAPTGPVPHIDAHALAISAEQEFPLPAITLQANPDPGRVNIDTWFWVSGYNGGILTHSKTQHASHRECRLLDGVPDCRTVDDSVTVVVHLTPKHYEWTFGDDRDNSASFPDNTGLGRAYTDPDPRDASPVAHAYHWSSINYINQGGYPVTLTVDWSAQFSANGGGFQGIPDVMHTFEGRQQVRQIQSVVSH